ncbi:MAG: hypothetical protein KJ626_02660 [Verrucomicrobia bacterium]|nr:hypothetical protein [Verrucomicrobiota bacterium]
MRNWLAEFLRDIRDFASHSKRVVAGQSGKEGRSDDHAAFRWGMVSAVFGLLIALGLVALFRPTYETPDIPTSTSLPDSIDLTHPVRPEPRRFKARTHMPQKREGLASGSIGSYPFVAKFDLVRVEDPRVWWESDHDTDDDDEDDHIMHRAMEEPFRRLVELVTAEGGVLKVQDAYRGARIHASRSLHKEGRAIDLTCDELGLEKLARLCWASGFDWVYNEAPKRGGAHVHASVRPD